MYEEFAAVVVFLLLGVVVVVATLLLGWFIRIQRPNTTKNAIYECGEPTIGSAWIRYNSRFYTVALVYLLFDVEVVVLVPAALVLKEMAAAGAGWVPLGALLLFMLLLVLGLAYEWRYGNLDWIGEQVYKTVRKETGHPERGEHVA
ncbi:MAG: NADH-quinone oxidoreductase subunit A [Candidatus Hydrogenedentes bacterium]|nr:NADH-quinone oxidoreductase subunit A [Candidatus Hydrogenedentota bacterium]